MGPREIMKKLRFEIWEDIILYLGDSFNIPINQSKLARRIGRPLSAAVTKRINLLHKRKWLAKKEIDKKSSVVYLTDKGNKVYLLLCYYREKMKKQHGW